MFPFTLDLSRGPFSGVPIEDEKILNKLSNEELSIHRVNQYGSGHVIIERGRIKSMEKIK